MNSNDNDSSSGINEVRKSESEYKGMEILVSLIKELHELM